SRAGRLLVLLPGFLLGLALPAFFRSLPRRFARLRLAAARLGPGLLGLARGLLAGRLASGRHGRLAFHRRWQGRERRRHHRLGVVPRRPAPRNRGAAPRTPTPTTPVNA